jgi:hypothetical protein
MTNTSRTAPHTLRLRGGETVTVTETPEAHPYLAFRSAKAALNAIARDPFEDVEDIASMEVREVHGVHIVFMLYSDAAIARRIERFDRSGEF